jgi:hypothetical protein|tara:strand:- start:41 stop:397 length:357 start_codon:yes stop_codon:yes gene_type:complete
MNSQHSGSLFLSIFLTAIILSLSIGFLLLTPIFYLLFTDYWFYSFGLIVLFIGHSFLEFQKRSLSVERERELSEQLEVANILLQLSKEENCDDVIPKTNVIETKLRRSSRIKARKAKS